MAELFSADYVLLWTAAMAGALFFPIRRLIWVITVRHAERDGNEDEQRQLALGKRATVTGALLALVFSYFYMAWLLPGTGAG